MINDIAATDAAGLDDYLKALWRRKHFVVLLALAGVILSAIYASSLTQQYTARAQIVVFRLPSDNTFGQVSLDAEQALMTSNELVDAAIASAKSNVTRNYVQEHLDVSFVPDSGVLRVAFSAPDAETAQTLATAIATTYVNDRRQKQTDFYTKQIASLNLQANELKAQIDPLTKEIGDLRTARNGVVLDPRYSNNTALQDQANQYDIQITQKTSQQSDLGAQRQQVLTRVSNLLTDSVTAPPPARVTRTARTPSVPDGLSDKMLYAIGLFGGLLAGAAGALFLDRFDGTIRGERDVEAMLGTPVLATVPMFPRSSATNGLVMLRATTGRRPAAARDSYRRLRSTLDFLAQRGDLKTFLVTSPRPGDGKSTTVVNLAIAAAQTGRKIAIVSADMHRPSLERLLSLSSGPGLSDYLLDESEAILTEVPGIPNLTAVTSGRPVETPAELLASSRVSELVKLLEENHDLVFFDTPPALNASDSLALASRVDGVIVVIDSRSTTSSDLEQLRDEMQLVGARITGAVLNYHRLGMKRNTYAYGPTRATARRELMSTRQATSTGAPRTYPPWERWFFLGIMSTLLYGLPNEWIRTYYGVQGTKSALLFYTPVLVVALFLGLQRSAAFMRAASVDVLIPLLLFWAFLSTVWSTDSATTFRQTVAWILATTFAYYAVTRFDLREILRLTAWSMLFGTALNLIFIFALPRYGKVIDEFDATKTGWKGVTSNKNSLGQFSSAAALILWMARRCFTRYRLIYTIGSIVNVFVVVRADAKTSLVALIGTGALMIVFRAFRAQRQLFGVAVIGLLGASVVVLVLILTNRNTLASGVGRSGDLTGRTALWDDLVPKVRERPIQGYGWGGFWGGFFSPAGEIWREHTWRPPDAHNLLLQLALDLGLVGVFLYFFSFLRGMARGIVYLRDSADPIAMLPIVWFAFELLGSITEHGALGRSGFWVLHVILIVAVGLNAKKSRSAMSPQPSRRPALRGA